MFHRVDVVLRFPQPRDAFGHRVLWFIAIITFFGASPITATQKLGDIPRGLIGEVMPRIDSIEQVGGDRPILRAYRADSSRHYILVGYLFLSSDFPPEPLGYSGPIVTLIGVDTTGTVMGARIIEYWESHRSSRGDFLRAPGVQEQFAGKHISESFSVGRDIDGLSRATISVRAFARGVRDAARRVAEEYLVESDSLAVVEGLANLTWLELRRLSVVERLNVSDRAGSAEMLLVFLETRDFGEVIVGADALGMADRAVDARGGGKHVIAFAVNGSSLRYFNRDGWSAVQGNDTIALPAEDIISFGLASGGMLDREAGSAGAMLIDEAVDVTRPFVLLYQLDSTAATLSLPYVTQAARRQLAGGGEQSSDSRANAPRDIPTLATADDNNRPVAQPLKMPSPDSTPVAARPVDLVGNNPASVDTAVVALILTAPAVDPLETDQSAVAQSDFLGESGTTAVLAETSWYRVSAMVGLLVLVTIAFFAKHRVVGTITLSVMLVFLGFVDGGFLSVTHITSVVWVGWSALAGDLSLVLLVVFTLITTIVFGRVFCGFLCPFGALQDFLTRLIPKQFQHTLSGQAHESGLYVKYVVLAVVVISAIFLPRVSLYQYVEPFGTVFYGSRSVFLWMIALGFIAAAAVIPRFYCRYVCPLGAGLAVLSIISLKRIGRVEQCDHCKVCEQDCPTGAIIGPDINFKECVRCNICEINLAEHAGVCRHSVDDVRERLVQIQGVRS